MRDFLTNIRIVGATMVFRGEELIRYCLDDLVKYCDEVVVLLDNHDRKTERVVLSYKDKYPKVHIIYSKIPRVTGEGIRKLKAGELRRRFRWNQGEIRDQVFQKLREINKKRKIDILLFPDSDEVFTDYVYSELLEKFWKDSWKAIVSRPCTIYDNFKILLKSAMAPHARIFKYQPELTAVPYKNHCMFLPLKRGDFFTVEPGRVLVHLCSLTKQHRDAREFWTNDFVKPEDKVWFLKKDIRIMTPKEIAEICKSKPNCLLKEL